MDRAVSLVVLGSLALEAAVDPRARGHVAIGIAAFVVVVALFAARAASRPVRALAAFGACLAVVAAAALIWQLSMLLAIASYAALARVFPRIRPPAEVYARGRVPWLSTAVVGGITPGALLSWVTLLSPDLRDITGSELMRVSLPLLIAGGVVFALINAVLEETIWRGMIQSNLLPLWGVPATVVLQALSFGAQHAYGFPRGLVGVALAASWAVLLGVLRLRARGLLAPVLAHVVADATIAVIVIHRIRG